MGKYLRFFSGLAVQTVMVLIGAATVLSLLRDSFHIVVHERFSWLIAMKQSLLDVLLDHPGVSQAAELASKVFARVFALLGVDEHLRLHPHWTYPFVLLALVFGGYAHAVRNFAERPAASTFRYGNALFCAFLGGVLTGSSHLAHPGCSPGRWHRCSHSWV